MMASERPAMPAPTMTIQGSGAMFLDRLFSKSERRKCEESGRYVKYDCLIWGDDCMQRVVGGRKVESYGYLWLLDEKKIERREEEKRRAEKKNEQ